MIVEEAEILESAIASKEVAPAAAAVPVGSESTSGWVGAVPTVCAVHCLVTPLFASTLPFFAHATVVEIWLVALSALMALASLSVSWRSHGQWGVWGLAAFGFLIWGADVLGGSTRIRYRPRLFTAAIDGIFFHRRNGCNHPPHVAAGKVVATAS